MQGESHHDRAPARPDSRAGFLPLLDPYTQEALRRTEAAHAVAEGVLQYVGSPVRCVPAVAQRCTQVPPSSCPPCLNVCARTTAPPSYEPPPAPCPHISWLSRHGDVRAAVRGAGSRVAASSAASSPSRLAPAYDFGQDAAPVNGHHATLPHGHGGSNSSGGGQRGWYDRYDAFGREVKDHGAALHQGAHGLSQHQQQQQYALNAAVALVQNRQQRGQWPGQPPPPIGGGGSHAPMPDGRHARLAAVEHDDYDDEYEFGYDSRAPVLPPPPPPSASAASTAAASLDDTPVTPGVGAAGRAASFEELLEAELAKQREVGAPSEAVSASDPSTRIFLRKGARAARTAPASQKQQTQSAVTRPESRAPGRPAVVQVEAPRPARGEPGGGHAVQQQHPVAHDTKPDGGASLNSLSGGAPRPFLRRGQGIMATSVGARQRKEALAAATAAVEASRVGTSSGDVDEGRHRAPSRAEEHVSGASQPPRRHVPGAGIRGAPQRVAAPSDYGYPSDEEVADPDDGDDYDDDERHAGSSTFGGGATSTAGYEGPRLSVPSAAAAARYSASMPRPAARSSVAGSAWDDDSAPWDDEEEGHGVDVQPSSDGDIAEPLHVLHLSGHGDSGAQSSVSGEDASDVGSHAPAPAAQAAARQRPAATQAAARHNTASEASDPRATCALVQTLFFDDKAKRAAIAAQHMHPARPQSAMGHKKGSAAAHAAAQSAAGGDATVAARLAALEAEMGRLKDERRRAEEARTGAEAARALLSAERAAFVRDRAAQSAALETQVAEASRKLERDRMVLQRESRAMLQIPGRKERAEMEELRAELAGVKEEMKARDVRAKTNADRLKRRVDELTSENEALREEVRRAEAARLAAEDAAAVATASARRAAAVAGHTSAVAPSRDSDGSSQRQRAPKASHGAAPAVALPSADDIARAAGVRGIDYAAGLGGAQRGATTAAPGGGDAPPSGSDVSHAAPAEQARHDMPVGDALAGCVWSARPHWDDVLIDDSALGKCTSETLHPDGRRERVFARGGRDVLFPNGTRKVAPPGGSTVVVAFANGDIKRTQDAAPAASGGSPSPDVWYYYAAVDTWHCTRGATGVEVFHFPTGQVEAHAPDGRKDILFPDGTARRVHPDGQEEELTGLRSER
jgi:hypothetical protein